MKKLILIIFLLNINIANASEITGKLYSNSKQKNKKNNSNHFILNKKKTTANKTIVLGFEKEYLNNILYRDENDKIYYIKDNKKLRIYSLFELSNWRGKEIINKKNRELNKIPNYTNHFYKNNELIRTKNMKIYEIKNAKLYHIKTLDELKKKYKNKKINNISYTEFKKYY